MLEKRNIPEHIKYVLNSVEDVRKYFVEFSAKSDRVKNPQFHVANSCEGQIILRKKGRSITQGCKSIARTTSGQSLDLPKGKNGGFRR